MTEIEYEGKIYYFSWWNLVYFIIFCPLIALAIYFLTDYLWYYTHVPVMDQTCGLINLITNMGISYDLVPDSNGNRGFYQYIIPGRGNIGFETLCTGVQAIAIFAGLIIMTPHSKDKIANKNIWRRKLWSLAVASFLFYIVNLFRMVLQISLYHYGFAWDDIHIPIGAASSFIAAIIILLMHRWIPEFVLSIMWISGEIRGYIVKKRHGGLQTKETDEPVSGTEEIVESTDELSTSSETKVGGKNDLENGS